MTYIVCRDGPPVMIAALFALQARGATCRTRSCLALSARSMMSYLTEGRSHGVPRRAAMTAAASLVAG